jgi:hypothetical protein
MNLLLGASLMLFASAPHIKGPFKSDGWGVPFEFARRSQRVRVPGAWRRLVEPPRTADGEGSQCGHGATRRATRQARGILARFVAFSLTVPNNLYA